MRPSRLLILTALVSSTVMVCSQAHAGNWFVRPDGGAYADQDGTDWLNAFAGFSGIDWAAVSCGDTIWVAGGTYGQHLSPDRICTANQRIFVRRARSDRSDATSAAGWSTGFSSQVYQDASGIQFNANAGFVTISGRTEDDGLGWHIDFSSASSGCGICVYSGGTDNTVEYLDLQGAGSVVVTGDMRGIDLTPSSGQATNYEFSHLRIRDWESGAYAVACSAPIFDHIEMYDIGPENWAQYHPNGIIIWGCPNGIVRYSMFKRGPKGGPVGEGVFFEQAGGASGWKIYGNVFANLASTGSKAIEISSEVGEIQVFNNTFYNVLQGSLYTSDSGGCSGGQWRNNLTFNAGMNTCGTASHNLTVDSSDVFVDPGADDYRIVGTVAAGMPRNVGTDLSQHLTVDSLGHPFGADGAWDVGAFEYVDDDQLPIAPSAPSDLRLQ